LNRVRLIELFEGEAKRLSTEGRELWEYWGFLLESAPGMESRMAREYEISERIFELLYRNRAPSAGSQSS
jgi:hypothetical protein